MPSLLDAAAVIAITGVIAYVAGWWWLYHFMANFYLSQLAMEIPKEYYLVYTYRIFERYWIWLIPTVAAICAGCFYVLTNHKGWISLPVIWIVFAVSALGFFQLAKSAANKTFEEMRNNNFPRFPYVSIHLHETELEEIVDLYGEDLLAGRYRYLFEIDDRLLLFREMKSENAGEPSLEVLNIRSPSVRALRFCAPVGTCVGAKDENGGPTNPARG